MSKVESQIREMLREEQEASTTAAGMRSMLEDLNRRAESESHTAQELRGQLGMIAADQARSDQNRSNLLANLEQSRSRRSRYEEELGKQTSSLHATQDAIETIRQKAGPLGKDWLADLQRAVSKAQEETRDLVGRASMVDSEIASIRRTMDTSREEMEGIDRQVGDLQSSIAALQSEITRAKAEMAAAYEPLIGRSDDPLRRLSELASEALAETQKLKDLLAEKEIARVRLSAEFRQMESQAAQITQQIEDYVREERKASALRRRLNIHSESKNLLAQIRDKYKDAREMIRTNLVNVLRETLRVEFERLYTYEDFHDVDVSENYEVSLEGPMGKIQAHNLSAGQKAIVSIAFRLAVAKAMNMNIGCWIIDEPTQNIGKTEVEALADVLADTGEIPQIILATHHEALGRHGHVISLAIRNGETVLGPAEDEPGQRSSIEGLAR